MQLSDRQRSVLAAVLPPIVILITAIALYLRSLGNELLPFDDALYVTGNRQVRQGLTPAGIAWAFTTGHAANWHPFTWISHMIDVSLFGIDPRGHHATNIVLNALNALLVYFLCMRLSARRTAAFAIGLLFAIHPLHVESVSWVSSRKDLLCALFWFLGLFAYVRYVARPSRWRYLPVLLAFICSFLSKPVAVTFPVVLMLLDYWPLARVAQHGDPAARRRQRLLLLAEKIPLFLLVVVFSGITIIVQRSGGAMESLAPISLGARINNALSAYVGYVTHTIWPVNLYIPYPHPGESRPVWHGVAAGGFLLVITALLFALRKRQPALLIGWCWFLVVLLPTIGLIQVGFQAMADRYMYIPLLGLLVIGVQLYADLSRALPPQRAVRAGLLVLITAGLCVLTWAQQSYWRNAFSLFSHAVEVRPDNVPARIQLAVIHLMDQQPEAAERHTRAALEYDPKSPEAWSNLGSALRMRGDSKGAEAAFRKALEFEPDAYAPALNLAALLGGKNKIDDAVAILEKAVESPDETGRGLQLLADFYVMQGRSTDAAIARDRARAKLTAR